MASNRGSKPRLLDLYAGAGGAARGYQQAGFYVVGVDIKPQPRYAGDEFIQADAISFLEDGYDVFKFDAVHASPPCQRYANVTRWKGNQDEHPSLIAPTRELLEDTGLPWVIENVVTPALRPDFVMCGTAFDLPIRRHRYFETNWSGFQLNMSCHHKPSDYSFDHGAKQPESVYRDAMGCEWMTTQESREAIPPAYTQLIGVQLLAHLAGNGSVQVSERQSWIPEELPERAAVGRNLGPWDDGDREYDLWKEDGKRGL